jgi:hypothetical protein
MLSPRLDRILVTNAAFKEGHELANAMSVCGRREDRKRQRDLGKNFTKLLLYEQTFS